MVFRSRSVHEGGWGREGLFTGQLHSGRAGAAPGEAYMSDGAHKRARTATSLDFAALGSVRVCVSVCIHVSVGRS